MNRNSKHLEPRHPEKRPGFDKDQPSEPAGPANPDRYAKETPPRPDDKKKHTEATMPPGQGVEPKRNTM